MKGNKKGTKEVFADLPGFSDNIRLTQHGTLLVPFAALRSSTSVLDLFGTYPQLRSILGTVRTFFILIVLIFFFCLNIFFSHNKFLNLEYLVLKLVPKNALLVEYDLSGTPLRSWHDPTGKVVESMTSAAIHEGKLYIGNLINDYIASVDY